MRTTFGWFVVGFTITVLAGSGCGIKDTVDDGCVGTNCATTTDCPDGDCNLSCDGPTCDLTCEGGGCEMDCAGDSCDATCAGGGCSIRCSADVCETSCTGGSCNVICTGADSCVLDQCSSTCNLTCNGATTCDSSCDVLDGCVTTP